MIPLGALMVDLIHRGWPPVPAGPFSPSPSPHPGRLGPGMGPAVVGTIVITFWATIIAVPLGILGAVYVVEYGAANRLSGSSAS